MQYPSLTRSTVRHIELVPMGSSHLMIVLIVNTGRVEQRVVDTGRVLAATATGEALVASIRSRINEVAAGVPFTVAATRLRRLVDDVDEADRAAMEAVVSALGDALVEEREERVVLAGQANLARAGTDFPRTIGPILEALEEHVTLLRLLGQLGDDPDLVSVRIGTENPVTGLQTTSLVSMGYGSGAERVASLGVLGPDPDGLPHDDGVGPSRRALRLRDPRREPGHLTHLHHRGQSAGAAPRRNRKHHVPEGISA